MIAKTKCNTCGATVGIDFSGMTYDEAETKLRKLDGRSMQCPGLHVEICGWWVRWNFADLLNQAYPSKAA
jgi:hypothetical protein